MSGTVYWSYPILPFGIVACTVFPTTFLEIVVYKNAEAHNVCHHCLCFIILIWSCWQMDPGPFPVFTYIFNPREAFRRATEMRARVLALHCPAILPHLRYPASRSYIFAVWDGERKVGTPALTPKYKSLIIERLDTKLADVIGSNTVEKCDVTLSRAIKPYTHLTNKKRIPLRDFSYFSTR